MSGRAGQAAKNASAKRNTESRAVSNERRSQSDKRLDKLEIAMEKIGGEVTTIAERVENVKKQLTEHSDQTARNVTELHTRVNEISKSQARIEENQKHSDTTLEEIRNRLRGVTDDRAAVVAFPKILAWVAAAAVALAAIVAFFGKGA